MSKALRPNRKAIEERSLEAVQCILSTWDIRYDKDINEATEYLANIIRESLGEFCEVVEMPDY